MDENEQTIPQKEVCTIRIMFAVDSDEDAIKCKRKIAEVLKDIPQVRFDFGLSPARQ